MSKTKAAGTTRLGRDSEAKRLGIKIFDGQIANPGNIIVRQHGTKYKAGKNVRVGKDYTLYAVKKGIVKFQKKNVKIFNSSKKKKKVFVHVI